MAKYNMTFEEAQEYISKRGFDIAWNDCDVFIDVRHITQAIGNVLKWADNNPKWKPSDLPHWKKSTLPNDNTTGFNSDYFCHKGYNINYKELFEKLPKDD